ncbi:hypothetical protein L6164_027066 [Bauhinia variegata]|uniref:Uncharacterized protein n=1 Tax=Bauhinia variegata TaxID=167791 RepID=A0ACB9LS35_BAUVA|nr:hypothetical protein L6164_027066 [Bauhinia variegata]
MSTSESQPPKPGPISPEKQSPIEQSDATIGSKVEALSPDQSGSVPFNGGEGGGEGDQEENEEELGECGFCLFMKGGGCRDSFTDWEKCVEEGEKNKEDIVEKCAEVTKALRDCMLIHADYYEPILRAEKAAEQEVVNELEKEAAAKRSEQSTDQNGSDPNQSQKDSGNERASSDK